MSLFMSLYVVKTVEKHIWVTSDDGRHSSLVTRFFSSWKKYFIISSLVVTRRHSPSLAVTRRHSPSLAVTRCNRNISSENVSSEMSLPKMSLPKISLPKISLPKFSLPKFSLPKMSVPKISLHLFRHCFLENHSSNNNAFGNISSELSYCRKFDCCSVKKSSIISTLEAWCRIGHQLVDNTPLSAHPRAWATTDFDMSYITVKT